MTQKKKTAVEWLIEKLESQYIKTSRNYEFKIIIGTKDIEQALAMEKEQMMDAFNIGMKFSEDYFDNNNSESENYYNKTYGK